MKAIILKLLLLLLITESSALAVTSDTTLNFDSFKDIGPFQYKVEENFEIRVSKDEIVKTDIFLVESREKKPLLIFQHGNKAHKGVHKEQAKRAASWGFNVITVEQPNVKRWLTNGKVLSDLTKLLYKWPQILNSKFDKENIILIGHSLVDPQHQSLLVLELQLKESFS